MNNFGRQFQGNPNWPPPHTGGKIKGSKGQGMQMPPGPPPQNMPPDFNPMHQGPPPPGSPAWNTHNSPVRFSRIAFYTALIFLVEFINICPSNCRNLHKLAIRIITTDRHIVGNHRRVPDLVQVQDQWDRALAVLVVPVVHLIPVQVDSLPDTLEDPMHRHVNPLVNAQTILVLCPLVLKFPMKI